MLRKAVKLLLAVALAELLLRLFHLLYPLTLIEYMQKFLPEVERAFLSRKIERDENLGFRILPNSKMKICLFERCFVAEFNDVKIGHGVRDKVQGDVKIIAVGDSYTMCFGVEHEECWTEVLERMLGAEVLNLGFPSQGVARAMRILEIALQRFSPELIIFQYHPKTDVFDDANLIHRYRKTAYFDTTFAYLTLSEVEKFLLKNFYLFPAVAVLLSTALSLASYPKMWQEFVLNLARARERFKNTIWVGIFEKEQTLPCDVCVILQKLPENFLLPDGHLSAKGCRWLANEILRKIRY